MAKAIRQNWSAIALFAVLILLVGTWNLVPHWAAPSSQSSESAFADESLVPDGGQSTVKLASPEEVAAHQRVQSLRRQLSLAASDLAALGCSQEVAEQVLLRVVNWEKQNRGVLEQANEVRQQADRALRETNRRINVGPRDPALIAQIPQLQRDVNAAIAQKTQLLQQLVVLVESSFTADQVVLWSAARSALGADRPVSDPYRFAGALTAEQAAALETARRRAPRSTDGTRFQAAQALSMVEAQVLNTAQKQAVQTARTNQERSMAAVLKAGQKVLPEPITLDQSVLQGSVIPIKTEDQP